MARPLRVQFEGALYHVINRGLERRALFKQKADYEYFLGLLSQTHKRFSLIFHAFCLMPNHYHLLVELRVPKLDRAMRHVNGLYTQYFNRTNRRVGPLFQGRYKAILCQKDEYLLQLSRYIHLNPVKAKLSKTLEDYPYSSSRYFTGLKGVNAPDFLDTSQTLSMFHNKPLKAMKLYRRFLEEGLLSNFDPTKKARFGFILGDESFFEEIQADYLKKLTNPEIPQLRQARKSFSIEGIQARVANLRGPDALRSKLLIYALKTYTPLTLKEIQERMKLSSHHMVCKSITRLKEASQKDKGLQKIIERLDGEMSIV